MANLEQFFRRFARNLGIGIAEKTAKKARRLSSTPYPPASRPGKPPRMRSGDFVRGISVVRTVFGARLVFAAPYSSFLLKGTRFMAARPVHEIALQQALIEKGMKSSAAKSLVQKVGKTSRSRGSSGRFTG